MVQVNIVLRMVVALGMIVIQSHVTVIIMVAPLVIVHVVSIIVVLDVQLDIIVMGILITFVEQAMPPQNLPPPVLSVTLVLLVPTL